MSEKSFVRYQFVLLQGMSNPERKNVVPKAERWQIVRMSGYKNSYCERVEESVHLEGVFSRADRDRIERFKRLYEYKNENQHFQTDRYTHNID